MPNLATPLKRHFTHAEDAAETPLGRQGLVFTIVSTFYGATRLALPEEDRQAVW